MDGEALAKKLKQANEKLAADARNKVVADQRVNVVSKRTAKEIAAIQRKKQHSADTKRRQLALAEEKSFLDFAFQLAQADKKEVAASVRDRKLQEKKPLLVHCPQIIFLSSNPTPLTPRSVSAEPYRGPLAPEP